MRLINNFNYFVFNLDNMLANFYFFEILVYISKTIQKLNFKTIFWEALKSEKYN